MGRNRGNRGSSCRRLGWRSYLGCLAVFWAHQGAQSLNPSPLLNQAKKHVTLAHDHNQDAKCAKLTPKAADDASIRW